MLPGQTGLVRYYETVASPTPDTFKRVMTRGIFSYDEGNSLNTNSGSANS
jgi:hypothetical protein